MGLDHALDSVQSILFYFLFVCFMTILENIKHRKGERERERERNSAETF